MNWFALWAATLLRRDPPAVTYADDHERAAAMARQRDQTIRLELLEREVETYRRRPDDGHG